MSAPGSGPRTISELVCLPPTGSKYGRIDHNPDVQL
jgi:hypothetical protein